MDAQQDTRTRLAPSGVSDTEGTFQSRGHREIWTRVPSFPATWARAARCLPAKLSWRSGGRAARTPLGWDAGGGVGGAGWRRVIVSGGLDPDRWPRPPRPAPLTPPSGAPNPGPNKCLRNPYFKVVNLQTSLRRLWTCYCVRASASASMLSADAASAIAAAKP